jgi:hypothetical protein
MGPVGPMTHWIKTPEDFVHWLASQLNLSELHTYFRDLEAIAKMSCDLELLRFARRYLASDLVREFASKRERLQELFPEGTHFATAPDSAAKRDQRSANR